MKLNKKIIVVLLFIIGIAGLLVGSIAYYRIVVSGSIEGSTGNAVFVLRDTEDGESWNNKVISFIHFIFYSKHLYLFYIKT